MQVSELTVLHKKTLQQELSYKVYEYCRTYYLLSQKIACRLLHNTSSIVKVSIALSAINSITGNYLDFPESAAGSDSDYLLWKYRYWSENNQGQEYHFVAAVDVTNKTNLAKAVTQRYLTKKVLKYLAKIRQKHLYRSPFKDNSPAT